jgi:hypothetical protein
MLQLVGPDWVWSGGEGALLGGETLGEESEENNPGRLGRLDLRACGSFVV